MNVDCTRCGGFGASLTLAGVYNARLCRPCSNDWNAYGWDLKQGTTLRDAEVAYEFLLAHIRGGGNTMNMTADAQELAARITKARKELYQCAKAWAEKKIKREPEGAEG